jgi:hypothetical protein
MLNPPQNVRRNDAQSPPGRASYMGIRIAQRVGQWPDRFSRRGTLLQAACLLHVPHLSHDVRCDGPQGISRRRSHVSAVKLAVPSPWDSRAHAARPQQLLANPQKVRIALRLRQETTMTLEWVAQGLHLDAKAHLSHLLY